MSVHARISYGCLSSSDVKMWKTCCLLALNIHGAVQTQQQPQGMREYLAQDTTQTNTKSDIL